MNTPALTVPQGPSHYRVDAALADHGVITSDTPKGDLDITFPARLATRWIPGLFPEQTSA